MLLRLLFAPDAGKADTAEFNSLGFVSPGLLPLNLPTFPNYLGIHQYISGKTFFQRNKGFGTFDTFYFL